MSTASPDPTRAAASSAPPVGPRGAVAIRAPRLLPFARFGVLFGWGLRRLFKARSFFWTGLLVAGVGVLAGLAIASARDSAYALWRFLGTEALGVGVPLIALALTSGGFGEEVSEQTLVFHLVRPVSRTTLFVARFAAGLLPAIAASCALAMITLVLSGVGVSIVTIGSTFATFALGTAVVGAIYYALAALFRRGLVAGLVYTFVVELLLQFMPGSIQKLALTHHLRSVFHGLCDENFASLSTRVADQAQIGNTAVIRPARGFEAAAPEPWTSVPDALLVCGIAAGLALLWGAWTVRRRDFALKD